MTILYSLVSRNKSVLAEYSNSGLSGNFQTATRSILGKIPSDNGKKGIIQYDGYLFSYYVNDGLIYLCMTGEGDTRRVSFEFLNDIHHKFVTTYGELGKTAIAFAMNEEFSRILKKQMDYFNSGQGDKLTQVKDELDKTKNIMVENIDKILERGEKIELLVDKTDRLNQQAFKFEKQSKALKMAMYWQNLKMYGIIAIVVIAIGLVLYFLFK